MILFNFSIEKKKPRKQEERKRTLKQTKQKIHIQPLYATKKIDKQSRSKFDKQAKQELRGKHQMKRQIKGVGNY